MTERPVGDDDLQAHVDGRLPSGRRAAVEAFLAERPGLAADLATDAALRSALRDRLAFKAAEPVPARLRIAHLVAERRRRVQHGLARVAAALLLLAAGGGAGWMGRDLAGPARDATPGRPPATQEAVAAFRTFAAEVAHPVEVRADQEAHLVTWLSRRLGRPLAVPDLSGQGFRLMGGRLLPAGGENAAQFMFEGEGGGRLTVYVRAGRDGDATGFRFAQADDVSAFSWTERDLAYVVTARIGRERLLGVAEAIDRQVGPPSSGGMPGSGGTPDRAPL